MKRLDLILERDGFIYGVLIPWFTKYSYGCDIGCNQPRTQQVSLFDPKIVEEAFLNCKQIGFHCVKLWLFEIMEGIRFDRDGHALGLDEDFQKNLKTIYEIADRYNLDLVITFQPHISYSMKYPEEYNFYTKIIFEPEYTQTFLDNVMAPLLKYFNGKEHILAFDIYAEPEGDVSGPYGNNQKYGTTWERMRTYLTSVIAYIRRYTPDIPITISSGWREYRSLIEGRFNDLDLDILGVDIYNDEGEVQKASTLGLDKPIWLGEFGPATKDNWSNEFQTENMLNFYKNAKDKGYIGAFYWMYPNASSEALTMQAEDGSLRPVCEVLRKLIKN